MFRTHVLIIRRLKLYYTASGITHCVGGRLVHETRLTVKEILCIKLVKY